jgi:hypothetical protein
MNHADTRLYSWLAASLVVLALLIAPPRALAHCDTLDGPVVADARSALASGEVTPVLKWVKAAAEPEIREAFARTLAVRQLDPQAQALADSYFFETLVRIHRAGEGAPYTGLKGAGQIEPVVAKADQALAQGSVDTLVKAIVAHTEEGIRERFNHALEARRHAAESVAAGREYVAAYVDYVHYVEGIAQVVHAAPSHGEAPAKAAAPAGHHH